MDTQELDRATLIVTLRETMAATYAKWGEVNTPFGKVQSSLNSWIWVKNDGWKDISIDKEYSSASNRYGMSSTDDLLQLAKTLPAMVQYLTSTDFINKVEGSISTLKKITKALGS